MERSRFFRARIPLLQSPSDLYVFPMVGPVLNALCLRKKKLKQWRTLRVNTLWRNAHPVCLSNALSRINKTCLTAYIGDLVLIHGSVLHKSERNTSPNTRFAYTFHMIESSPLADYDEKNWLQPTPAMPFSRVLGEGNSVAIAA